MPSSQSILRHQTGLQLLLLLSRNDPTSCCWYCQVQVSYNDPYRYLPPSLLLLLGRCLCVVCDDRLQFHSCVFYDIRSSYCCVWSSSGIVPSCVFVHQTHQICSSNTTRCFNILWTIIVVKLKLIFHYTYCVSFGMKVCEYVYVLWKLSLLSYMDIFKMITLKK